MSEPPELDASITKWHFNCHQGPQQIQAYRGAHAITHRAVGEGLQGRQFSQ